MTKRYLPLALVAAGCASRAPKQAPPPNDVAALLLQVAPECPKPVVALEPDGPLRAFVQIVDIDAPVERLRTAASIEELAADPSVKISSKNILAQDGERAALGDTAITPHIARASSWITIDVTTESAHANTTLSVFDGQRIILGSHLHDGRRKVTMLVPTIVSSPRDLQRIFECKKEQARLVREHAKS